LTVFRQKTGAILGIGYNALVEMRSPFWRGNDIQRHNANAEPFVSWFAQPFFAIGLYLLIRSIVRRRQNAWLENNWRWVILLSWLVIGSAPNLFAESLVQPHGLRLILVQPLLALIASIGFVFAYDWLKSRYSSRSAMAIVVVVLLAIAIYNYDAIFRRWANDNRMHHDFNYPQYELARTLDSSGSPKQRVVIAPKFDGGAYGVPVLAQSIAYLTHTVTPDSQRVKNIHYAFEGEATDSDSVEVYRLPW
jgi:hypothetical protein